MAALSKTATRVQAGALSVRQLHPAQGLPTPTRGLARARSLYAPGALLSARRNALLYMVSRHCAPGTAWPLRASGESGRPPPVPAANALRVSGAPDYVRPPWIPQRPRGLSPQARRDHAVPSAQCRETTTLRNAGRPLRYATPGAPHRQGARLGAPGDYLPTTLHRGVRHATYNFQPSIIARYGLRGMADDVDEQAPACQQRYSCKQFIDRCLYVNN